ncbi:polyphosphate kinase [Yersinia proxima]|uniref:polyphosphate kinase n=1 Tax=Yersinia proxima TaxID=2890316 RepID=UPI001D11D51F|nr:polyphosphate kinase [Yersinia proxima]
MLSKEQLEKIANQETVDIGGTQNPIVTEMAVELLSLREQLAELKALPPIGRVISCSGNKTLGWMRDAPEGTLLFTAAKPAEIPRHIFSILVNELRDVPAIGCKRELIIGVLNRHGVIAEPVQCDPPATE